MSSSAERLLGENRQLAGEDQVVERDRGAIATTRRDGLLWALIGLALLLRSLLPLAAAVAHHDTSVFMERDTPDYVLPAQSLISSGTFYKEGRPAIERTPGFPLLLIPGLLAGHLESVTIALQILLSTLTVFFVYLTSKTLFSRKVAYWCAALYALEPLSILYCSLLLSETLFTFCFVLFLYQMVRYVKQGSLSSLLAGTLALAAATYVRPVSYYLPIVLVLVVFYAAGRIHRRSTALLHALAFFLFYFALVGAWQVRNYEVSGYRGFTAVVDGNLYFNQGVSILAKQTGRPFYEVQREAGYYSTEQYNQSHPDQGNWSPVQKYAYMHREGMELIRHNLLTYALIHLKGMLVVVGDGGGIEFSKLFKQYPPAGIGLLGTVTDNGIWSALNIVRTQYPFSFYAVVFFELLLLASTALALSGAALGWFEARTASIFLVTVAVYFVVLSGGPMAAGRYRHPIMPILCIFAGYALACKSRVLDFFALRKQPSLVATYEQPESFGSPAGRSANQPQEL